MEIKDLKHDIENNNIDDRLIIFIVQDNNFIAHQYINEISKQHNLDIEYIEEIIYEDSIFEETTNNINVLITDKFDSDNISLLNKKNTYIICKSFNSIQLDMFKKNIVNIPKLEKWQIKDYAYCKSSGISTQLIDELIEICKYDIYRIDNELDKINIFEQNQRKILFEQFINDDMFNDMSKYTIFNFSNALITHNYKLLANIYKQIENIDCEPLGLVTTLINNVKNIILVQLSNNPTPESTGIKPNQFWAIKHLCNIYTKEQLVNLYVFLTDIDKKIKIGDMPMDKLIDLLVVKVSNI